MSTPDKPLPPSDDQLRAAFDFLHEPAEAFPPPPPQMWEGVQAQLRTPISPAQLRAARWQAGAGGVVLGALLALVLVWWGAPNVREPLPHHGRQLPKIGSTLPNVRDVAPDVEEASPNVGASSPNVRDVIPNAGGGLPNVRVVVPKIGGTLPNVRADVPNVWEPTPDVRDGAPIVGSTLPNVWEPLPNIREALPTIASGAPAIPAVIQPLLTAELTLAALPTDTGRATREHRRQALREQRTALAALTHHIDSLLLAEGMLPETPPALPVDTTSQAPAPTFRRWSVALAFAPERNFFGLQAPATDSLAALRRTHEQGRAGFNAMALGEYRLNDRWSVGAGLGVSSYGAELRLTDRQTDVSVAYDTQTHQSTQTTHVENTTYSIRLVQEPLLTPRFNINNQIIGYDTVYVPRQDTVWTKVITDGTVVTNSTTTTPTVTTRRETSTRILRPDYRFLTLPVLVRYRLGTEGGTFHGPHANRWWADVALGAQLQFFLGGTQLTSPDGQHWRTERVGPGGGPFRPFTVALTGAVALNYALTPRLSASVAPTLRYQTESVYKASTGLTQRPAATGLMMGLRWAF